MRQGGYGRWCRGLVVLAAVACSAPVMAADTDGGSAAVITALRQQKFSEALAGADALLAEATAAAGADAPQALQARVFRAQALYGLGRLDDAVATLEPFLESLDAGATIVSARVDWTGLTVLGDSFMAQGRWDEAGRCLRRALVLVGEQPDPADTEAMRARRIDTATTLGKIGTVEARLGDWEGARATFEAQEEALAAEPDGGGVYLAAARNGQGLVADNQGDHAAAALHYAEAARIYEQSFGADHPYTTRALQTLHRVQGKLGNEAEATRTAQRLAAVGTRVGEPLPPTLGAKPAADPARRGGWSAVTPGWPVVAAIVAAALLAALVLSGFFKARGVPTDDATDGARGDVVAPGERTTHVERDAG